MMNAIPDDNEVALPPREIKISTGVPVGPWPAEDTGQPAPPPVETSSPRPAMRQNSEFRSQESELLPSALCLLPSFSQGRGMAPEESSGGRGLTAAGCDSPALAVSRAEDSQATHATPAPDSQKSEVRSQNAETYFAANVIARAAGVSAKTIHRRAASEGWPAKQSGNRFDYVPPASIAVLLTAPAPESAGPDARLSFTALALNDEAKAKVHARLAAVEHHAALIADGQPVEAALIATVSHLASALCPLPSAFLFSTSSLRRWLAAHAQFGINGLVEQKQGRSGRKGAASFLPDEMKSKLKADTLQHGSAARAARNLMRSPELPYAVRKHLHEGHASKSYVPPSIRQASQAAPLTAALLNGPKKARLEGRFTPCHNDAVKEAITSWATT